MKKSLVYSLSSVVLASSIFTSTSMVSAAQETSIESVAEDNQTINLQELISAGKIKNANLDNKIYSVTYEKDNQDFEVEYNGNTGLVTINGEIQQDLTYEYNSELAIANPNNTQNSASANNSVSLYAAAPKAGYSYVGTLKGHTKEAKNAAALATQLGLLIPGSGWTINSVRILLVYTGHSLGTSDKIPSKYYTYDLYQKGFMTTNWYQYSTLTLYEDKNYKTKSGQSWTSNPQKIDLPNS